MPHAAGNRRADGRTIRGFLAARTASAAESESRQAVARTAIGAAILLVAVDEVRDLIINGDVIELCDRELDAIPGVSAIDGDTDAAVVGDDHAIAVRGIDPHVVIVAAGDGRKIRQRFAAVD